jgi:hypothetical protein
VIKLRPTDKILIGIGITFTFLTLLILAPPIDLSLPQPRLTGNSKAAIIDTLWEMNPNQTLTDEIVAHLKNAGFQVDIYRNSEATVKLFKTLPTLNYKVLVLRMHSLAASDKGVMIITGEHWDATKYVTEQLSGELAPAVPLFMQEEISAEHIYFAITPDFIKNLKGDFNDTLVIASGCQGMANSNMAEAFIEKGCRTYIGWSDLVSAWHTDEATANLTYHLFVEGTDIDQAVNETMREVGPDPHFGSILKSAS